MRGTTIRQPQDIEDVLSRWKNRRQENFLAITLDGAHKVIKVHHVSKGLVNRTMVHPRECYYPAVKDNAVAVVFAHNHPSNSVYPSAEDYEVTERLSMAGNIMGFHALDHVIITPKNGYYSFRQAGKLADSGYEGSQELKQFANELAAERRKK